MLFSSYTYLAFLAVAFLLHWLLPPAWRKPFLLACSYVFYCSWRWQFGFLLFAVSVVAWSFGLILQRARRVERWLTIGVALELLPLLYFKYLGFLSANLSGLLRHVGVHPSWTDPVISIPLGISFFSFQGIAYLVDVAGGAEPIRKPVDFLLFKAFWPQLIAGPIVRPDEIREQLETPRSFSYDDVAEGSRRILSGLFRKVVLADLISPYVDSVFLPGAHVGFVDALCGIVGFGLQIYWDFGAYSSIAIGSARLFGYRFPENFNFPYLSRSPQEFWNRWHMSLSRWIRDYVFTPLSFALRGRKGASLASLLLAMAICGLWHGAGWTFVLWGVWHGVWLVLQQTAFTRLFASPPGGAGGRRFSARGLLAWAATMVVVFVGWLLFRARSLSQAMDFVRAIATMRGGARPMVLRENGVLIIALLAAGLFGYQLLFEPVLRRSATLERRPMLRNAVRGGAYALGIIAVIVFDRRSEAFVYFQF